MIALVATHADRRVETLRMRLLVLQHQHVEWLANYLEWEMLTYRGENLKAEMGVALMRLEGIREQMAGIQRRIEFWTRLRK